MNKLKILFATDFSPNSKIALQMLKCLEKIYKTDISLIYVLASFWKDWLASGLYQKEARQRLQTWQQELGKKEIKKLYVKQGNPADTILQVANEIKAELIFLGSKNSGSSGRYKTGTTVEAVVRAAQQSVWVCKHAQVSQILCGIDGSAFSAKALNWAMELCRRFSAKLCIVSVLPHIDFNPLGMDEIEIQEQEEKFKMKHVSKINKFLQEFDFSNIDFEKYFFWGIPANLILDTAEDFNYDLIVIGAKGHSKLQHVLIGSTAEKILRYAPCSLLVVR